jgi:hypothetical protein
MLKQKIKKKKRKKIGLNQVLKWFAIALACTILIAAIVVRLYYSVYFHKN